MAEHHTPFALAAQCFPPTLRNLLHALPASQKATAEELRLRAGSGLRVVDETGREQLVPDTQWVTQRELQDVIEIATHASFHNAMEPLCRGYLPLPGGNRLGVAGSALSQGGRIRQFRSLSSLAIRIAHDIPGVAEPVAKLLNEQGLTQASCLILAPPGMGKTTLLRDLIRIYSDQWHLRVGVADERGEIAALHKGVPQFYLGATVDVIEGCGKSEAGILLLRSMNPQVIAMDEVTSPEDVAALSVIAHCGTAVLATAPGQSVAELCRRPLYQTLLEQRLFQAVVTITRAQGKRQYTVEVLPC